MFCNLKIFLCICKIRVKLKRPLVICNGLRRFSQLVINDAAIVIGDSQFWYHLYCKLAILQGFIIFAGFEIFLYPTQYALFNLRFDHMKVVLGSFQQKSQAAEPCENQQRLEPDCPPLKDHSPVIVCLGAISAIWITNSQSFEA